MIIVRHVKITRIVHCLVYVIKLTVELNYNDNNNERILIKG